MAGYADINSDLLSLIPLTSRRVLEIGSGTGDLRNAYLRRRPDAVYTEIAPADLERLAPDQEFDALVLDDVLAGLADPRPLLSALRDKMDDDATCIASIPNINHWSLLRQRLNSLGDSDDGSPLGLKAALGLFTESGWSILGVKPQVLWPEKTEQALKAFAPLADSLGIPAHRLRSELSAQRWLIHAAKRATAPHLHLVGLGLKATVGVNEARVDFPLAALDSLPRARVVWGAGGVSIPDDFPPGVLMLHRQFMNNAALNAHVEKLISKGWLVVADMDDDPLHWPQFAASNYFAYRSAHAVTVSTEPLAEVIRPWNPNVKVFPNAIFSLPPRAARPLPRPLHAERKLRVFFGALNRGADWKAIHAGLVAAATELRERIEFVVVHDRAVFDSLPDDLGKEFHPTLPQDKYMAVLAGCDIALLPLSDTRFNRLKSDLKFIECCAAGVVPLCSPVVYGERPEHHRIGLFPAGPEEWGKALLDLCDSPAEIARRQALGFDYVRQERMHHHQVKEREAYYLGLLQNRDALEQQRRARLAAAAV